MRKRRQIELFSISFLDLLSGALGAVIILYVAIPKNQPVPEVVDPQKVVLQNELASSQKIVDDLKRQLTEASTKIASLEKTVVPHAPPVPGPDLDAGFSFKGKNIVFIIDTSYSMTEEDRMGQVKAGLKMLLTSLSSSFKIDIVHFPLGQRAPFRSMWGNIKNFSSINRSDAFDFIYALRPSGGTPTRDTLMFVLQNYENVSDIVLLSDGAPTYHNSNNKDDIYEILRVVRENNSGKIQINTIGVGSTFMRDKLSEQYKFLSLLASENNGFFVGF